MVRALLVLVAAPAATLALTWPAAAEPLPAPCGSDMCIYHQLSDDEEWADDEESADDEEWADDGFTDNPLGVEPNLGLCGGFDTAIDFIGVYTCLPLIGE